MSEYSHPYPAVRRHGDYGWKTDCPEVSEGLVWVVRTQEVIDQRNKEEAQILRDYEETGSSRLQMTPTYEDEYVVADRVEHGPNGELTFCLGTPQHNVAVKVYAHGYWREYHLLADPHEIASRTATMLKEEDNGEA